MPISILTSGGDCDAENRHSIFGMLPRQFPTVFPIRRSCGWLPTLVGFLSREMSEPCGSTSKSSSQSATPPACFSFRHPGQLVPPSRAS